MKGLLSATGAAKLIGLDRNTFLGRAKAISLPYIVLPGERIRYDPAVVKAAADKLTKRHQRTPRSEDIQGPAYLAHIERAIAQGLVRRNADGRIHLRVVGEIGNRHGWATKSVDRSVRLLIEQGRAVIGDDDMVRPVAQATDTGGTS